MEDSPVVLIDGLQISAERLIPFAIANDGHFTAMQVRDGSTRGLDLHLQRLRTAHRRLYGTELDVTAVRAILRQALRGHPDCYLRVTVTERIPGQPEVMTVVRPPLEPGKEPVDLTSVRWTRAFPDIKHVGTFPQIQIAREASRAGFADALLVDEHGRVTETTIANIAFIADQEVYWPVGPSLEGISWRLLETALDDRGFVSERRPVTLDQTRDYTAAVRVNSIGVEAVARIDSHEFSTSIQAAAWLESIYRSIQPTPI
jgi:branched-subunit amino acid aminotransferase/4-amino-4-deoxychorismate lyase